MRPHSRFLVLSVALTLLISCSDKETSPKKSSLTSIKSFVITNLTPNVTGAIDTVAHVVDLTFPIGTNITNLIPSITTSPGSTVNPNTNIPQDFSKAVVYTVTAEDGTTQLYTVKSKVKKSSAKNVLEFAFNDLNPAIKAAVDTIKHSIVATVPIGTNLTNLSPTIKVSDRASISPSSLTKQDFSKPVSYTVTAEDGTTQTYQANITIQKSNERAITSFTFSSPPTPVYTNISEVFNTIEVIFQEGTDVTKLAPVIAVSKDATISPASGTVQDFSKPVNYTVTSASGLSQVYTVNVKVLLPISDQPAKGSIENRPNFTVKTALMVTTTSTGAWKYRIKFYDKDANCETTDNESITFTLPAPQVGTYVYAQANFQTGSGNPTYTGAEITITKVTATTIEGKVRGGNVSSKNYLEGSFSAKICN